MNQIQNLGHSINKPS